MNDQEREWIIYFTGFGWSGHPMGCYPTAEDAMPRAGIGQPVEWVQTGDGDYVGYPLGDRHSKFFYTINQDGRAVFDALIGEDEQSDTRPNPVHQMARFRAWSILKKRIT